MGENAKTRNGDKEKMTKARGAADSIGKAGGEASFLLPAFSPYYVPYFPLFLRAHQHTHTRVRRNIWVHVYAPTHPCSLSFLSSLSSPCRPSVLYFSALDAVLLLPLSLSFSLLVIPPPSSSSSLLYVCAYISRICSHVRVCASSQSSRTRFHVARLYAPAARGRLCTWVNGKMSFETFLGRSRSPHCQSCTRAIPLLRSSCRSRENVRRSVAVSLSLSFSFSLAKFRMKTREKCVAAP